MNDSNISTPPPETEENPGLRYLEPASLLFFRHGNTLRMTVGDEFSLLRACVVRAFPLSRATSYISVLDGSGKEVGMIRELAELTDESRLLVQEELTRRYVIPVITRIISLRERCETEEWVVETERGPTDFSTRNLHEASSEPSPGRLIIADVEGNRYEIPSIAQLDPASRRFLSDHL